MSHEIISSKLNCFSVSDINIHISRQYAAAILALLWTPRQEVTDEGATQAQIELSVEESVGHMWVSINILFLSWFCFQ